MKRFSIVSIALAASLAFLTNSVQADTVNLVTNGDFDTSPSVDWAPAVGWFQESEGGVDGNFVTLVGPSWFYSTATPTIPLVAGQTYEFSFQAILVSDNGIAIDRSIHASAGTSTTSAVIQTELTNTWTTYSAQFTATEADAGTGYGVSFLNSLNYYGTNPANTPASCTFGIDSVSIRAVPEPASCVMLSCGLFGLLAYAWRKRR